ncbi:U6 small nuclear RNA (adenine-(43)-N(6))-methyltransferase [Frankliniella occidentalis]|uniref:U6 small nuclear RNA (adenine-(43)-N(6))-methyltransferase n=1 Tax=Frankliniella occidentalis TaxID=133901 RepID=A0A6J1S0D3_FRAOC|nr:U6 small nuclear RNA (adenine-(43)-N(6))-methyltransferase [Frankliniella occidentalis]
MALNKKMHPRNPYKTQPSFKDLAVKNEEFRLHATIDISGKVSIDFKKAETIRALTRALLKEDWNLDVTLPKEYLVPTVPLRLNYILWIEDLVAALKLEDTGSPVYGIDIGTGASCIYPLLASRKNGWNMIGVEKDNTCLNHAQQNVLHNKLESLVKVCKNDGEMIIDTSVMDGAFEPMPTYFHFTMCNPPFFSSEEELEKTHKSRSANSPRPPPNNARTGSANEVVVEGGEVAFVHKMIDDSQQAKDKIRIFTTMLGHKSSVSKVLKYLKEKNISEIASTEFCQGHTTRWGIAWSHVEKLTCESLSADNFVDQKKQKSKPPVRHVLPTSNCAFKTFDSLMEKVKILLKNLDLQFRCVIKDVKSIGYQVTALNNTWSNQRRKRRDEQRMIKKVGQPSEDSSSTKCTNSQTEQITEVPTSHGTNSSTDLTDEPPLKKAKLTESVPLLVFGFIIREEETEGDSNSYVFEMSWLHGSGGKDLIHQVMQYVKNNLK